MTPTIPPSTAAHALWLFGAEGGLEPGGFTLQLLRLLGYADHDNRRKLTSIYPAEAAAVQMAQLDPDGIDTLQRIAAGGAAIYCDRCWGADGPFEQQPDGSHRCEGCIKKAAS